MIRRTGWTKTDTGITKEGWTLFVALVARVKKANLNSVRLLSFYEYMDHCPNMIKRVIDGNFKGQREIKKNIVVEATKSY